MASTGQITPNPDQRWALSLGWATCDSTRRPYCRAKRQRSRTAHHDWIGATSFAQARIALSLPSPAMRIDEILAGSTPVFSFEFFPPRDPEGVTLLFATVEALKPLHPDFVSVTYGAGGATRDGTVDIATQLKHEHGLETMAHLSCVGETRDGPVQILDRLETSGIENVLALRGDPPRGLSRGPPGGEQPRGRPRLPEDQGDLRGSLPDHAALLRQPRLLRVRPGCTGRRDRR